jgi:hypothetical protein
MKRKSLKNKEERIKWAKGLQADVASLKDFDAQRHAARRVVNLEEQFLALVSFPCLVILDIFYLHI